MNEKEKLMRQIGAISFAAHELTLFLDTHPENRQAIELLEDYRKRLNEAVASYEQKFGRLILSISEAQASDSWEWLSEPWPWEQEE